MIGLDTSTQDYSCWQSLCCCSCCIADALGEPQLWLTARHRSGYDVSVWQSETLMLVHKQPWRVGNKSCALQAEVGQKRRRGGARKLIELSLEVARVCAGLRAEGVQAGMALPGCVRSVEDHGYTLALGPKGVEGVCRQMEAM